MTRVLVVEDSPEARALVERHLRSDDCEVLFAENGTEALSRAVALLPDLILLDVGLPDHDGFDVCTRLRSLPSLEETPIIFLTGRDDIHDKVMAFKLGADDYVEKPFDGLELRARVEARLRRARGHARPLRFGDLRLDPVRQEVTLQLPDCEQSCDLTPHEFRILYCLASRRGDPVSRDQLMASAWGGVKVAARTIDTHVSNLRSKIAPIGKRLEAVRGTGYRLANTSEV